MTSRAEAELWALLDEPPRVAAEELRRRIPARPWTHREAFAAAFQRALDPRPAPGPIAPPPPGARRFRAPEPYEPRRHQAVPAHARTLADALLEAIQSPGSGDDAWLLQETARRSQRDPELQAACLQRLTSHDDPGDAGLCFGLLERAWDVLPTADRLRFSEWMVDHGTGELRARAFEPLVIHMGVTLAEHDVERAARLLAAGLSSDGRCPALFNGRPARDLATELARLVELADPSSAMDVVEGVPSNFREDVVSALLSDSVPRARRALLENLGAGRASDQAAAIAWRVWAHVCPSEDPRITAPRPALMALQALALLAGRDQELHAPCVGATAKAALTHLAPAEWVPLLAGFLRVGEGGREALSEVLDHALSSDNPNAGRGGFGAIRAKMALLAGRATPPAPARAVDESPLLDALQGLVRRDWSAPTLGVDFGARLAGRADVRLVDDLGEAQVELRPGHVALRRGALSPIAQLPMNLERQIQVAELFLLHELVHLSQGVGAKATVRALRSEGLLGEMTLMHLDLGADHVAAKALAQSKCPGKLTDLKALQAESLRAFPFHWPQGSSSLRRKSLRLVGLLLDAAVRRARIVPDDHTAYFAADLVPTSGTIHVLEVGAIMRVHSVEVDVAFAEALSRAAEPRDVTKAIDAVVGRLARVASATGP